jgi:hypothetical protein
MHFIFTYDLVAIPWLIQDIGQREGGVDLWEVGLRLLFLCMADRPCWSTDHLRAVDWLGVRRVLCEFLSRFISICWVDRFGLEVVGRTVRLARLDRLRGAD